MCADDHASLLDLISRLATQLSREHADIEDSELGQITNNIELIKLAQTTLVKHGSASSAPIDDFLARVNKAMRLT